MSYTAMGEIALTVGVIMFLFGAWMTYIAAQRMKRADRLTQRAHENMRIYSERDHLIPFRPRTAGWVREVSPPRDEDRPHGGPPAPRYHD